jgi:hypothetical protein
MTTLCIDVGLKNLALCVLNKSYEILLWDVYDVLENDNYTCEGILKNGNVCGKKCSMKYKVGGEVIHSCKTHFPKDIPKTKLNEFKRKSVDAYLLQDIAKLFLTKIQEIYDTNLDVFKRLDSIQIELQLKCNQKMKFISHILYGKFIELYLDTKVTIRFVRASQKLKAYTGPYVECKLKNKYSRTKWYGIQYGTWILKNKFSKEQQDLWLPTLTGKLDDRFDCFLMAINSITGIPKKRLKHHNGNELK